MTDHPATDERDQRVARRLAQHQSIFLRDLDAVLDTEAGLREVLLHSRHNTLVDDLDAVLDLESGLADILPTTPAAQPGLSATTKDAAPWERYLQPFSPQHRMALRAHPGIADARRDLDHDIDLARPLQLIRPIELTLNLEQVRSLTRELASALSRAIIRDLDQVSALDLDRVRCLASDLFSALDAKRDFDRHHLRELVAELTHAHSRAHDRCLGRALKRALALDRYFSPHRVDDRTPDPELGFGRALNRAVSHVQELARDLVLTRSDEVKQVISDVLGRELPALSEESVEAFLNDFTTSDLRTADLKGIDLDGVRWSETRTRWPEAVDVEDLKNRSKETLVGSGVWVVQSGSATLRDLAELT